MLAGKIFTHARMMPDEPAIIYGDHQLSCREFASGIDATRRYFSALGLSNSGVAVLAIASILDSWLAGPALRSLGITTIGVPLAAEQLGQLGLPDIQFVVTSEIEDWPGVEAPGAAAGWRHIRLPQAIYADIKVPAASEMPPLAEPEGGHILLTSGTTGHYKKILLDPDRRASRASLYSSIFGISGRSVVNAANLRCWTGIGYQRPSLVWDLGATVLFQEVDMFTPLRNGGITHMFGSPWTLAQALAAGGALRRDDAMRLFVTGGALSQSMADEIRATVTRQVYTYVASTEVGAFTLTPVEGSEDLRWHRILPSSQVQIVDAEDRILLAGQEGRLRIRVTDGLNGYLHDDKTSRAFFRDGYFYSGDLGVIGQDGRLALLGRMTDVVNVLGSKFVRGPIEEAVQREFGVSGACVFSVRQANGEEVVHIAIESRQTIDVERLASLLGSILPGPFQASVHIIDALPRNHMGKIQRDILKQQLGCSGKVSDRGN